MKLSALIVAATAGLAAAAPIRIVIVKTSFSTSSTSNPGVPGVGVANGAAIIPPTDTNIDDFFKNHIRVGHPAIHAVNPHPHIHHAHHAHAHPCKGKGRGGHRMLNKWREFFGLPPVEVIHSPIRRPAVEGEVNILPYPHTGGLGVALPPPEFHRAHAHVHMNDDRFIYRLQRALLQLNPWEGTALSFVIGCGIGVLIRMLIVFSVLFVRARRAARANREGQIQLPATEVIFVAPPEYVVDVKEAPVVVEVVEVEEKKEKVDQA